MCDKLPFLESSVRHQGQPEVEATLGGTLVSGTTLLAPLDGTHVSGTALPATDDGEACRMLSVPSSRALPCRQHWMVPTSWAPPCRQKTTERHAGCQKPPPRPAGGKGGLPYQTGDEPGRLQLNLNKNCTPQKNLSLKLEIKQPP